MFERVIDTVNFSRGLFGRAPNPAYVEQVLRDLSLWDKRHAKLMELSGGMKRRVLIARRCPTNPTSLPRRADRGRRCRAAPRDMWKLVHGFASGASRSSDHALYRRGRGDGRRVGVIAKGKLLLVEEKAEMMKKKLGKREMVLTLAEPMPAIPPELPSGET